MQSKNKTTLYNIASTVVLQGLAFFSGPIFSTVLGTENYGIAAVYLTWVQVAATVFSLQAAGAVAVARVNYPSEVQEQFQSSTLGLATLSYFVFSVVTLVFALFTSRIFGLNLYMLILGLTHGWGFYCVSFMNLKLTYEFKADKNFVLSVITSGLTIGMSLLLIKTFRPEDNYWGRIIGQSLVYTLIGIVIFIYILHAGKQFYNKDFWLFTIPITIPTIFHSLAHIVLNQGDKVMIQNQIGNSPAGVYALASTFSAVMNAVWHAFNNSWVPFYYEYTRQGQIEEMKKHARNYINLFTVIAMGYILLSREVFHLYAANTDFWEGTDLIPLFALGYYMVFLYSFPVNFEFYNKKTGSIAVGTTVAALLNIIMNYYMIKWWGITGAVIATAIAHGFLFIFHYFNARRIKEAVFPFRIKDFLPGFIAVCCVCMVYVFSRNLWYIRWGGAMLLGIYLVASVIKRREIF